MSAVIAVLAALRRRAEPARESPMRFDIHVDAPDNGHPEPGEKWWQYNERTRS